MGLLSPFFGKAKLSGFMKGLRKHSNPQSSVKGQPAIHFHERRKQRKTRTLREFSVGNHFMDGNSSLAMAKFSPRICAPMQEIVIR
jgi:hypothetical protein